MWVLIIVMVQNIIYSFCKNYIPLHCSTYVTVPAKIGQICTQKVAIFLNFNLRYLLKYKSYDNEIFVPYSQINKKAKTVYSLNILSTDEEKHHFLNMCNLCRYTQFSQAQSHMWLNLRKPGFHTQLWMFRNTNFKCLKY